MRRIQSSLRVANVSPATAPCPPSPNRMKLSRGHWRGACTFRCGVLYAAEVSLAKIACTCTSIFAVKTSLSPPWCQGWGAEEDPLRLYTSPPLFTKRSTQRFTSHPSQRSGAPSKTEYTAYAFAAAKATWLLHHLRQRATLLPVVQEAPATLGRTVHTTPARTRALCKERRYRYTASHIANLRKRAHHRIPPVERCTESPVAGKHP